MTGERHAHPCALARFGARAGSPHSAWPQLLGLWASVSPQPLALENS